ncbi:hypothetical protein [Cyanobium sp. CH-040]|uniref:hypothetical protein n=1 Tax=Cyanobium sp. CH-040 TaxID=2823708 RepID=UPI0020CD5B90|nr:hypothetical protein [Cyanobium sp. CH-040]MCP9928500.1 hypothetical protein [Cyanobium sp. CH-040]
MCFWVLLGLVGLGLLLRERRLLRERLNRLEEAVQQLEGQRPEPLRQLAETPRPAAGPGSARAAPEPPPQPQPLPRWLQAPEPSAAAAPPPPPALAPPAPPPPLPPGSPTGGKPPLGPDLRQRLERLLVENWTGILGVVVLVAGVSFIAIHAALRLSPLQRFLLTSLVALGLTTPSLLVGGRPRWRNLSAWMRSGGGALFLLACTASGGLPQLGLQWIDRPEPALALIALAVLANLLLAALARTQTVASLHVVVNLVPLAIVPQSGLILGIASAVALTGLGLPPGRRWSGHQLVVTWAYVLYHLAWVVRSQPLLAVDPRLRAGAALAAVLVFGGGALLQHHRRWRHPELRALPLALVLSQAAGLAVTLVLYPRQAAVRALSLGLVAVAALLLAQRCRRRGWPWLALTDALTGQGFAVAALFSLQPLVANPLLLLLVVQAECLAFLWLGAAQRQAWIRRTGWALSALSAMAMALVTLLQRLPGATERLPVGPLAPAGQTTTVLLASGLLLVLTQVLLRRRDVPLPLPPLLGWLAGVPLLLALALTSPEPWRPALITALLGGLLVLARPWPACGVRAGLNGVVVGLHGQLWLWLLRPEPWQAAPLAARLLPPTLVALLLLANRQAVPSRRTGWLLLQGTGTSLVLATLLLRSAGTPAPLPAGHAAALLGGAALFTALLLLLDRWRLTVPWGWLGGWMGALLALTGSLACLPAPQRNWLALAGLGLLLVLARRWRPQGLLAGSTAAVAVVHGVSWELLLSRQPWQPGALLLHLAPVLALALVLHGAGRRRPRVRQQGAAWPLARGLGLDLFSLGLSLGVYLLLAPRSPLLPGVAWLLLALLHLETADRLEPRDALHLLGLGLINLLAYGGAYLLVISQSPAAVTLGPLVLPGRLLIELLAVLVLLYGWFFRPAAGLRRLPLWRRLQPCLLEATLLAVAVLVLNEVELLWRPLAWSALAVALLSPPLRRLFANRLQVYAVLLFWLAMATLVAILATLPSPSLHWASRPQLLGLLAIALQVLFIVAAHRWLDPALLRNPGGLPPLAWIGRLVARRPFRWLYLPLFAAVAYYLALRYDRSLLTLLWAAQAFVVFALGLLLREPPFRTLALAGLAACLVRLLWIDMSAADLSLRGLVFVGVGVLMLAMNALASRFGGRLD